MLIRPTGLTLVEMFFWIVPMAARFIGLISIKTKEYLIWHYESGLNGKRTLNMLSYSSGFGYFLVAAWPFCLMLSLSLPGSYSGDEHHFFL